VDVVPATPLAGEGPSPKARAPGSAGARAAGARGASSRSPSAPPATIPNPYRHLSAKLLRRVGAELAARRATLAPLCACGHSASPLDLAYPYRCCSNCHLHGNPAAFERILMGLLDAQGLLPPPGP